MQSPVEQLCLSGTFWSVLVIDERPNKILLVVKMTAGESSCRALWWNTHLHCKKLLDELSVLLPTENLCWRGGRRRGGQKSRSQLVSEPKRTQKSKLQQAPDNFTYLQLLNTPPFLLFLPYTAKTDTTWPSSPFNHYLQCLQGKTKSWQKLD